MTRNEFRKCVVGDVVCPKQVEKNVGVSVTDPSFAQSGREMVFNPLPYNPKPIYQQGVPLDKMHEFDGMYKDKLDVFQSAKEFEQKAGDNLKKGMEDYESKKQSKGKE